jgi:hypothetical protein
MSFSTAENPATDQTPHSDVAVETVGMFLCPNRNLTTLTAAVLSLHPHVQVLNHGLERLRDLGLLRFLESGEDADLEQFIRGALAMSRDGRRGDYGGSILLSHAYDRPALRAAYVERYGEAPLKPAVRCLVWKEGARLREFLKAGRIDPVALAERLPRLRFISPLRHPIAHLRSLQKYYAPDLLPYVRSSLPDLTQASVARYVLSAHDDFLRWHRRCPAHFHCFGEDGLEADGALRLLAFLGLADNDAWGRAAAAFFVNDGPRVGPAPERAVFEELLRTEFRDSGELRGWFERATAGAAT